MAVLAGIVIGWTAGTFALSNILLPLFWAWPRARRFAREGKLLKPIPASGFIAAPMVWIVVVSVVWWIVAVLSESFAIGFGIGLSVSFPAIAKLITKPNEHMEADFADSYGDYLADEPSQSFEVETHSKPPLAQGEQGRATNASVSSIHSSRELYRLTGSWSDKCRALLELTVIDGYRVDGYFNVEGDAESTRVDGYLENQHLSLTLHVPNESQIFRLVGGFDGNSFGGNFTIDGDIVQAFVLSADAQNPELIGLNADSLLGDGWTLRQPEAAE